MKETDFERNEWNMGRGYASSFGASFIGLGVPNSVSAVVAASGIHDVACVDAERWMSGVNPSGTVHAKDTVRVLHGDETSVVALEFRNLTRNPAHRMRRIYNLFFALAQHVGVSIEKIRERLVYAVVMEGMNRPGNTSSRETEILSAGLMTLARETWEYDVSAFHKYKKNDERKLSGLICRKAYLLYENELGSFAKAKGILP